MKRRKFNLLAGTSLAALATPNLKASAQSMATNFVALSQTTLTPVGAERAGNAAGTIPAWTGGMTTVPADWNPNATLPPDFFASDKQLYTVDAANMAQYADLLSDGVQTLMQKQGFSVQVYPTHRTAAAPQWVYDNIAKNSSRATLDPAGGRLGFSGGYGGIPFPVPDATDADAAGAQIMWNHITRWTGYYFKYTAQTWVVVSGVPVCSSNGTISFYYPYYDPKGSLETFAGYNIYEYGYQTYPSSVAGEQIVVHESVDAARLPDITWELQLGLGRVRKAPELTYDTPSSFSNGLANFDEFYGFYGALDEYDWKLVEKREMLIPYNVNKMCAVSFKNILMPKYPNPDTVRWELHRVWVLEATLHPGKRNVLARRRFYCDEDTWTVVMMDGWDGNGNIFHHEQDYLVACPQVPALVYLNQTVFNLQTGNYAMLGGSAGDSSADQPFDFGPQPVADYQPQTMAANSTY